MPPESQDRGPLAKAVLEGSVVGVDSAKGRERAMAKARRKVEGKGKSIRSGHGIIRSVVDVVNKDQLWGYCSFRFDTEETMSSRDVEVIYWCVSNRALISPHSHLQARLPSLRSTSLSRPKPGGANVEISLLSNSSMRIGVHVG